VFLKPIEIWPMARAFQMALGEASPERGADVA
jgi:hypothetical protein